MLAAIILLSFYLETSPKTAKFFISDLKQQVLFLALPIVMFLLSALYCVLCEFHDLE